LRRRVRLQMCFAGLTWCSGNGHMGREYQVVASRLSAHEELLSQSSIASLRTHAVWTSQSVMDVPVQHPNQLKTVSYIQLLPMSQEIGNSKQDSVSVSTESGIGKRRTAISFEITAKRRIFLPFEQLHQRPGFRGRYRRPPIRVIFLVDRRSARLM
jgi:hypothetical protein